MRERRVYAGQAGRWDDRRNTSKVHPVPFGQLERATAALDAWRAAEPRHAAWVAAGAPPIRSQADHVRWFGCEYSPPKSRTRRSK